MQIIQTQNGQIICGDGVEDIQDVVNKFSIQSPPIAQTEIVFSLPVRAPDFFVSSPTPEVDPLDALNAAENEWNKTKKSIASIVGNMKVYLVAVEKKIKVKEK